jgi:hypothetical protein
MVSQTVSQMVGKESDYAKDGRKLRVWTCMTDVYTFNITAISTESFVNRSRIVILLPPAIVWLTRCAMNVVLECVLG